MNKLDINSISRFLAFTVGPNSDFIDIDDLNSIELQDNKLKSLFFFKEQILDIFNKEIDSYKLNNESNIGVLLSGGLDSTLLLSLLREKFPKANIYTYTLSYTYSSPHLPIAREIANNYSTNHSEIVYDLSSNLEETFNDIYSCSYDLEGEDSLIMNHILAKKVKKDCSVVFSGFGLDYIFAGMDLFRNSFIEKLYNFGKVDKKYILDTLGGNKYYLKYVLDKINSSLGEDFFIKYGEYYGGVLKENLETNMKNYFFDKISEIRGDISILKKQIYFIIFTSLSNRYNPYNNPYKLLGIKHYNPFGSRNVIEKIISLNIPDNYLYNVSTKEKKFIIRDISRDLIKKDILDNLHSGTVLSYDSVIKCNKDFILSLVKENRIFLSKYFKNEYLDNLVSEIDNSIWYEKSKQIVILLQFLFYCRYNNLNPITRLSEFEKINCTNLETLKLA